MVGTFVSTIILSLQFKTNTGFSLWWARQDLNLSYVNRSAQSIDPKADLLYPKHRPLIDFAGNRKNRKGLPFRFKLYVIHQLWGSFAFSF